MLATRILSRSLISTFLCGVILLQILLDHHVSIIYHFLAILIIALSATGNVDGIGLLARLSNVKGIVVDSADTYAYICDYGNNKIRRVDLSNSSYPVITVASGISGCWGLSIDKSKNSLFAVASKSHVVYKVAISNPLLYPISPTTNNIIAGQYG